MTKEKDKEESVKITEPKITIKSKDDMKKEELDKIKKEEEKLQSEWQKNLKHGKIIEEEEYFEMRNYIEMVIRQKEHGCIIQSRGGTGKTYTTLTMLAQRDIPYAYINSYSTPAAFYISLYKARNMIKVIDDVHKLLENDKFSPYLKAILEDFNGLRKVSHNSTKNLEDANGVYPLEFYENGGTIILTNRINEKNIHIDAILSRVPKCELRIDNKRMLELMNCMALTPYKDLNQKERYEVLKFCKENLQNSMDLNLRTFKHAMNFYDYAKSMGDMSLWGRLILLSLKKDDTDLIILQVVTDASIKNDDEKLEAINKQLTNSISRATYYRKKDQFKQEGLIDKFN